MLVSDFVEDLWDRRLTLKPQWCAADDGSPLTSAPTYLILRVQHDFDTFVGGGDVRRELHTSCRTDTEMRQHVDRCKQPACLSLRSEPYSDDGRCTYVQLGSLFGNVKLKHQNKLCSCTKYRHLRTLNNPWLFLFHKVFEAWCFSWS